MPVPAISPTTVNAKYLSAVRGLFQYLVDRKTILRSPMDGVHSKQKEQDLLPVEKRLPFTKRPNCDSASERGHQAEVVG